MTHRTFITARQKRAPKRLSQACRATLCVATLAAMIAVPAPASAQLNKTMHSDGWILAAAHAPGQQGSIWRTDLGVRFQTSGGSVTLDFCESKTDNTGAQTFTIEINRRHISFRPLDWR